MTVTEPTSVAPRPAKTDEASTKDLALEVKDLVLAYAKQETLDPLKALGRFVAFGLAGAVLLAAGTAIGALAIVRAVQVEAGAHLDGDLSWVPYAGGVIFALAVALGAVTRIGRTP